MTVSDDYVPRKTPPVIEQDTSQLVQEARAAATVDILGIREPSDAELLEQVESLHDDQVPCKCGAFHGKDATLAEQDLVPQPDVEQVREVVIPNEPPELVMLTGDDCPVDHATLAGEPCPNCGHIGVDPS